ncbi:MAG: hypothetical protein ACYSWP_20650 [Planctomycetota bacterium]|jgi:uncharacterized protein (DUF3820 family)
METSFVELTEEQKSELEGYVAWTSSLFQVILFLLATFVIFKVFRYIYTLIERDYPALIEYQWMVPALICTICLYCISKKWAFGRKELRKIDEDLKAGNARLITIEAIECIEVTEREDEGPGYIIKDKSQRTVVFAGQYLLDYERKGFPWTKIGILEAPKSKVFFGLKPLGEPLKPSFVREPLTREEIENIPDFYEEYKFIDIPFESFKVRSNQ